MKLTPAEEVFRPRAGSGNAYDDYVILAENILNANPPVLDSPKVKVKLGDLKPETVDPFLESLAKATAKPCDLQFRTVGLLKTRELSRAWNWAGAMLTKKIGDCLRKGDKDKAIEWCHVATKFGFDLSAGNAQDATLGYAIVNDARKALMRGFETMGAGQLSSLARKIEDDLTGIPDFNLTIDHESQEMRRWIDDLNEAKSLDPIQNALGLNGKEAIEPLRKLSDRTPFIKGLTDACDREVQIVRDRESLPASEREWTKVDKEDADARKKKDKPAWENLSTLLFKTLRPTLELRDLTLARTRLLILNARCTVAVKTTKQAPKDLSKFGKSLVTDPYTGQPFIYRSTGDTFTVYSTGSDFQDGGGISDESGTTPDLILEKR